MSKIILIFTVIISTIGCGSGTNGKGRGATPNQQVNDKNVVAPGEPTEVCSQHTSPTAFKVCVYKTPRSVNPDVLYFLHGLSEDEHAWLNTPAYKKVRALWYAGGFQPPTVVGVSFGPQWLLTEKTTSPGSGLYPIFVAGVIPAIEAELGALRGKRLLMGESMGGFNASQLFLKSGALFNRVLLACPALATLTPFSTTDEISAYTIRTNAKAPYVALLVNLMHYFFPTEEAWSTSSPFALLQTNLSSASPRLNVSCGDQDEFGFFEGAKAFAQAAKARGVDATWTLLHGGHCTVDPQAIATFLE